MNSRASHRGWCHLLCLCSSPMCSSPNWWHCSTVLLFGARLNSSGSSNQRPSVSTKLISCSPSWYEQPLRKINGMDLTTNPRYFDIKVQQCTYRQGVVGCAPVTMEKCTRAHWAKLGNLTENFFELYRMSESLCPSLGFNVDLQGRFSFPEFKDLEITFQQCVGVAGVDCRTAL